MNTSNNFIWKIDHYAYHITNTTAMQSICAEGLLPSVGERSILAGDSINGIFFFSNICFINDWIEKLYKEKNIYELELLRFNLKGLRWIIRNPNEFYLLDKVNKEEIEYLRIYNRIYRVLLPLDSLSLNNNLMVWNGLNKYKPLIKRKETI